jgi:hypothetical protein
MVWQQIVLIALFIYITITTAGNDSKPGAVRAIATVINLGLIALVATI